MKLIIHEGTGTIIDADDGVFYLNTDTLNDDDRTEIKNGLENDDDDVLVEFAARLGRRITGEKLEQLGLEN